MPKFTKIATKSLVCLLLVILILGSNLLWLKVGKVYGETITKYGTTTNPTGLTNALADDGVIQAVNYTRPNLSVMGYSSDNLGSIDSIEVYFDIPSTVRDTQTKGLSLTWNLRFYYGPNTSVDYQVVKTGDNLVAPSALETKTYSVRPDGQPWQWTDIQNFRLALETTANKAHNTVYNVDSFYIKINYTPVGDTIPPAFTLNYYQDEALTMPLPIKDNQPVTKAQTVYIKATPNETLSSPPELSVDAPGTGNDFLYKTMTYNSGGYYLYAWNVIAGYGDGLTRVTVTGSDQSNNTGSTEGMLALDTTINKPNLQVVAGHHKVELTWSTTDTDIKEYRLFRSTSPNFAVALESLVGTFTSTVTNYTDTNVVVNQTYYYKLVSKDVAENTSLPSEEVSAAPFKDTSFPTFRIEYFKSSDFSPDNKLETWENLPITTIQQLYLKIEASEDLTTNPIVYIDAPGTVNDAAYHSTEFVSNKVYRYTWNLAAGADIEGTASVFVSGEDTFGNKSIDQHPEIGGKVQIDTTINSPVWSVGYPVGGPGYVDISWQSTDRDIKFYKVYREINSNFTVDDVNDSNLLVRMTSRFYRDSTATAPNTYYYQVMAVDYAGNKSISTEGFGTPEKVNPHGNYVGDTNMCAQCHQAHGGGGSYNLKDVAKKVCYVCHDAGGQSIYDSKSEFNLIGSHHPVDLASTYATADTLSCSDCHNPHLDWATVPRLLTTKDNSMSGNAVCWTCHGSSEGTLKDKQTNFPALGVGHNNNNWTAPNGLRPFSGEYTNPSSGTNIGCTGCHEEHGSTITKMLRSVDWNNDAIWPSENNNSFCYECHKESLNTTRDNAWDGSYVYENVGKIHMGETSNTKCSACHDPHGTPNANNLKSSYAISERGANRTKAFDPNDYKACTSCHGLITDLVNPINSTGFSSANSDWPVEKQNLHYYHLNQLASKGLGNAVCKECHRPHGAISKENSGQFHLVGFPSYTVSSVTYDTYNTVGPNFIKGTVIGGSCNLSCHGTEHRSENPGPGQINSSYYGGSPPVGGGLSNGGQDCADCHNKNANSNRLLIDSMKARTGGFKHLIDSTNTYSYIYDPNSTNCLNTCHVDHDLFNENMGANLRASINDTSPTVGVNTDFIRERADGGICTSCHLNTQNKRYDTSVRGLFTKPVDPLKYKLSGHDYEVSTTFTYDNSSFRGNCVKCHNDNMGKDSIGSAVMLNPQLAMHTSDYKDGLAPFNLLSPPNPLGYRHCYGCHGTTGEFYKAPNQVPGDVETDFKKTYRHKIEANTTWNYEDCKDCHDTHYSKKGNRISGTGGGTIDFTKVAPSMVGATGVYPTQWQAPPPPAAGTESLWSPTGASGYTTITLKENDPDYYAAYVCLKCHSSYVQTLPRLGSGEVTKDKVKDFNPNNITYHPVFGPGKNVWLSSATNRQAHFKAPWNTTSQATVRMTCMDCHNAPSDQNGPFGVHGSSTPFMLRAYGPDPTVSGSAGPYDKLCYLCHNASQSSFRSHLTSAHGTNDLGCLACHAGPAGKVTANNGGRRGSIHGANFKWSSGTNATSMLMGGYITGISGRNCTVAGCSTHTKAW